MGAAGTQYRVLLSDPLGGIVDLGTCTVPNSSCVLHEILGFGAPPTLDQATVALLSAQLSASQASGSAATATTKAAEAASSALGASTSASSAGTSAAAALASSNSANSLANTAFAQAGIASTKATEAAASAETAASYASAAGGIRFDSAQNLSNEEKLQAKTNIGISNVENKTSAIIRSEITSENIVSSLGYTPLNAANRGASNGVASLDGSGLVPSSQLPSYVDDVIEFENFASLPLIGDSGKIYVLSSPYTSSGVTSSQFRWSGSAYAAIIASPGSTDAVSEGSINLYFTDERARAAALNSNPIIETTSNNFRLVDASDVTKKINFNLSGLSTEATRTYSLPNLTTTLAGLGVNNQTFTGNTTFSANFILSTVGGAIDLGGQLTGGSWIAGGNSGTGTITLGRSNVTQTTNIQAGATASGSTKTVNIGTGGLAGSTTAVAIGSSAGTSTININGTTAVSGTFSCGFGAFALQGATGYFGQSNTGGTYGFGTGPTASGQTKTLNFGNGGLSGSATTITIGSITGTSTTTLNGIVKRQTYTVSSLPSAATSGVGATAFVTDALTPAFGQTVTGGSTVAVPVYSDGVDWKVG